MEPLNTLPPVELTPLRQIYHPKGDIFHAMKISDPGFAGFGEAYFTHILNGETKGWKKHYSMWINFVVPCGEVAFFTHDPAVGLTREWVLGSRTYARLTVPPGYWVAFQGRAEGVNLVLNLASIEHRTDDAVNLDLDQMPLSGFVCGS